MQAILAIDPGAGGSIVVSAPGGVPNSYPMPKTEGDIIDVLRGIVAWAGSPAEITAYMEEVGNGIIPGRARAMITLNVNAAVIRTALALLGVRLIKVKPGIWQKPLGLGKRVDCATDSIWKNKLKAEAQRRFPGLKITLATSDALLILDYARNNEATH